MPLDLGGGMTAMVVLSECVSDGALAVVEYRLAPHARTRVHTHSHEDEYAYVLEGDLDFTVGECTAILSPGEAAAKPRGLTHSARNVGSGTARYLSVVTPGGFDRYLELVSDLLRGPVATPREALDDLASRYGLDFSPEAILGDPDDEER